MALCFHLSQKFTLHWSFQLENLNFFPVLQHLDGTFIDPKWTDYNKLSDKILSYSHGGHLGMWAQSQWAFKHYSAFALNYASYNTVPPLISHFQHGLEFALAQTLH